MASLSRLWKRISSDWVVFSVLSVPTLLVVVWFGQGNYIHFIDGYFPFNPLANLRQFGSAWGTYNGIGTLNVTNFPLIPLIVLVVFLHVVLDLPLQASQAALYLLLLSIGSAFMFLFIRQNSFQSQIVAQVAGVIGAAAYVLSPVYLDLYWYLNFPGAGGLMAGLPAMAYFLSRGTRIASSSKLNWPSVLGFALASVVASTSEVPYIASAVPVVIVLVIWAAFQGAPSLQLLGRRSLFLASALLSSVVLNAFWLGPEASATGYIYSGPGSYSVSANLSDLMANSAQATPYNVLTLHYFPLSNTFGLWQSSYSTSVVLSVVLPTLTAMFIVASLMFANSKKARLRSPSLVTSLFVLYLLLAIALMGSNSASPFGSEYVSVFNSALYLQPFLRGPYLTWGGAYAFTTAILIGVGASGGLVWLEEASPSTGRLTSPSSYAVPGRRRLSKRYVGVILALAASGVVLTSSWPLVTGAAVSDLAYPATPRIPTSALDVSSYLATHLSRGNSVIVYPGAAGVVSENWTSGYVGPPILPILDGVPTIEDENLPLGASQSYELSMAYALPAYNASSDFGNLLRMFGTQYLVFDGAIGFNQLTYRSNTTSTLASIQRQPGISSVATFGPYRVFELSNPNPIVYSPSRIVDTNHSLVVSQSISDQYANLANNSTASNSYWTSTGLITNVSAGNFSASSYWPNASYREAHFNNGTGLHYPGWPEITNVAPLNIKVADTPLLFVNLTTQGNFTPIISFSGVSSIVIYPNSYVQTIQQFFGEDLVSEQVDSNRSSYHFVFNLATFADATAMPDGILRHIMIEFQPNGNYTGYLNASVNMSLGYPVMLSPGFDPGSTGVVPSTLGGVGTSEFSNLSRAAVAWHSLNAGEYQASISNITGRFVLVFDQTYDANWILTSSDESVVLAHFPVDGYANGWLIQTPRSAMTLTIEFALQKIVGPTQALTIGGSIVLVMMSTRALWWRRVRRLRLPRAPLRGH